MLAHRLRQRITIQEPTKTQDPTTGEVIETWQDLYIDIPAEVLEGPGKQNISSGADQNEISARINLRYIPGTSARDMVRFRILWEGGIYTIKSAVRDLTARREWRLMVQDGKIDA